MIYWKTTATSHEDKEKFFSHSSVDKIIVIENGWLEKMRRTQLYQYTFSEQPFERFELAKTAGYYISFQEVAPLRVDPVEDLIKKLLNQDIELRFTPELHPIRDSVVSSTLDFSIIRFRNAQPAPQEDFR